MDESFFERPMVVALRERYARLAAERKGRRPLAISGSDLSRRRLNGNSA